LDLVWFIAQKHDKENSNCLLKFHRKKAWCQCKSYHPRLSFIQLLENIVTSIKCVVRFENHKVVFLFVLSLHFFVKYKLGWISWFLIFLTNWGLRWFWTAFTLGLNYFCWILVVWIKPGHMKHKKQNISTLLFFHSSLNILSKKVYSYTLW